MRKEQRKLFCVIALAFLVSGFPVSVDAAGGGPILRGIKHAKGGLGRSLWKKNRSEDRIMIAIQKTRSKKQQGTGNYPGPRYRLGQGQLANYTSSSSSPEPEPSKNHQQTPGLKPAERDGQNMTGEILNSTSSGKKNQDEGPHIPPGDVPGSASPSKENPKEAIEKAIDKLRCTLVSSAGEDFVKKSGDKIIKTLQKELKDSAPESCREN